MIVKYIMFTFPCCIEEISMNHISEHKNSKSTIFTQEAVDVTAVLEN